MVLILIVSQSFRHFNKGTCFPNTTLFIAVFSGLPPPILKLRSIPAPSLPNPAAKIHKIPQPTNKTPHIFFFPPKKIFSKPHHPTPHSTTLNCQLSTVNRQPPTLNCHPPSFHKPRDHSPTTLASLTEQTSHSHRHTTYATPSPSIFHKNPQKITNLFVIQRKIPTFATGTNLNPTMAQEKYDVFISYSRKDSYILPAIKTDHLFC